MPITRIIGDIHGKIFSYKNLCQSPGIDGSIQLGDFGVGFAGEYWHNSINEFHSGTNHRFIRGNHDKPVTCKTKMSGYIQDGTVEGDKMFMGGAWSIDNPNAPDGIRRRTKDFDWWADEQLSAHELNIVKCIYSQAKPNFMFTHDCPAVIAQEMFFDSGILTGKNYHTDTAAALESMLQIHQPKFWFFGHWHHTMIHQYGKTTFICLGELDYIDLDLDDDDQINNAIAKKFT